MLMWIWLTLAFAFFQFWLKALIAFQPLLVFFKAIERVEIRTIAKGDEAGNAHIQPHDAARGLFCYHFAAGLNRRKPLAAGLADCHVADFA